MKFRRFLWILGSNYNLQEQGESHALLLFIFKKIKKMFLEDC